MKPNRTLTVVMGVVLLAGGLIGFVVAADQPTFEASADGDVWLDSESEVTAGTAGTEQVATIAIQATAGPSETVPRSPVTISSTDTSTASTAPAPSTEDGSTAATPTVRRTPATPATAAPTARDSGSAADGPGFGPVVVLAALLVWTLAVLARSR